LSKSFIIRLEKSLLNFKAYKSKYKGERSHVTRS